MNAGSRPLSIGTRQLENISVVVSAAFVGAAIHISRAVENRIDQFRPITVGTTEGIVRGDTPGTTDAAAGILWRTNAGNRAATELPATAVAAVERGDIKSATGPENGRP